MTNLFRAGLAGIGCFAFVLIYMMTTLAICTVAPPVWPIWIGIALGTPLLACFVIELWNE